MRFKQEPRCSHLEQKWWKPAVFSFLSRSGGCGNSSDLFYLSERWSTCVVVPTFATVTPSTGPWPLKTSKTLLRACWPWDHVLTGLVSLHLTDLAFSLDFKMLLLTLRALHGLAPVTCLTSCPLRCLLSTWDDLVSASYRSTFPPQETGWSSICCHLGSGTTGLTCVHEHGRSSKNQSLAFSYVSSRFKYGSIHDLCLFALFCSLICILFLNYIFIVLWVIWEILFNNIS